MNDSVNSGLRSLSAAERAFILGMILWLLLQLSRAIAMVLIDDINAGGSSEAWRYPAYLDLFAVIFVLPLVWAVWAHRGLITWAALISYWIISIVDHFGNFVTTTFVGAPSIAEGMNPFLIPIIQTVVDIVLLILLFVPKFRALFFRVQESSTH